MRGVSGETLEFTERDGTVSVDAEQRKADLDEDGDADAWDGLWAYRGMLLMDLGYGPIMSKQHRDAHATNYISDDEIRANLEALATRETADVGPVPGLHKELDTDEDSSVSASTDGVDFYRYFANGGGLATEGRDEDPDSVLDSRDPGGAIEDIANPNLTVLATEGVDADGPILGVAEHEYNATWGDYIVITYDEVLYRSADGTLLSGDLTSVITSVEDDGTPVTGDCEFEVLPGNRGIIVRRKTGAGAFSVLKDVVVTIDETAIEDVAGNDGLSAARQVTVRIADPGVD